MKNTILLCLLSCFAIISPYASPIHKDRDEYLTGYIQSLFVLSYGMPADTAKVENGVIIIQKSKLGHHSPTAVLEKVKNATAGLKGIKDCIMDDDEAKVSVTQSPKKLKTTALTKENMGIAMPNHSLFQPLIADPKWPRFTVAYQHFSKGMGVKHVFAPNFGASFPIYRMVNNQKDSEWEIGVQGGLFGIMDIGRNPTALVNADYFIGLPITHRSGSWSYLARIYHVSSHLGDEYMLTPEGKKVHRINLSYEGLDLLASHNFDGLRLYGGGGYILHKEPSYIKRLKVQGGSEYYAHSTFMDGMFRPVVGLDIKAEEQGKWHPGISFKAGVQLENSALISNKVQLMLEYYSGKSIHGQFYKDKIQYIGIGLHAFL